MALRKLKGDRLFDGYRLQEGQVLVIDEEGQVQDIVPEREAGEGVESYPGILSPGFINCHCHLELSHMRGLIPPKTGLVDFVFKVVTERHFGEKEILQAIEGAEMEMMQAGIVAVGDICNNTLTLPQKSRGRLRYYNFIESSGWAPSIAQARFERAQNIFGQFDNLPSEIANRQSIVPHAPYSVSNELWQHLQEGFEGRVVSIHNQETAFEDQFFTEGTGDFQRMYELMKIDNSHHVPTRRSSLQSYFDKLRGAKNILLVHNTFTREEDVVFVNRRPSTVDPKVFFCLCINANLYIEDQVPPVEMLRRNGVSIVLGTDSLASNWSLSIADEMKAIRHHFPQIPTEELLQWATSNGAKALDMEARLGSFEKGTQPGIVLLDEALTSRRLL